MSADEGGGAQPLGYSLLSVIIPAYNAAVTIREQLDALKAQMYDGRWEILVVDNRSTDDTGTVIQQYQKHMPFLHLIRATEKQGRAYACNIGAQAAKGDAFLFCDADDVVAPGWLAAFAEALKDHELVAGTIEVCSLNQGNKAWRPAPPNWAMKPVLNFLPFVGGALMAVSRTAFERVGGFSEDAPYCEDIDLSWRLQLHGYTIYHVPEAIICVRYRDTWQGMWKQIATYAAAHVYLYKHFAAYGMPRSSIRKAWKQYVWLIVHTRDFFSRSSEIKGKWMYQAAVSWGRFVGSLHYHTFYL